MLLTDLSKAFDCVVHDLLIAKLYAYGFTYSSLRLINSYLSDRQQRVRINSKYSSWSPITFGVPQGSILGGLLFNIDLCDLFYFLEDSNITNYADDNSPFSCESNNHLVLEKLDTDCKIILEWAKNNGLKANPSKFHLILSDSSNNLSLNIDSSVVKSCNEKKLLGIKIDNKLSFESHVTNLCTKASQKLHALSRISNLMDINKRKILFNTYILSQFSYCPLVWMFHSRKINNRINRIHERALRLIYNDYTSSFDDLLTKNNAFTVHERNIQTLAIELFKVVNGTSPTIMSKIFKLKEKVRYPSENIFVTNNIKTVKYGQNSLSYLGPKIWYILPKEIRDEKNEKLFKFKIRKWKPTCPCNLCKTFIKGIGYLD